MPFACPKCLRSDSLTIGETLHLPSDARSDDIILQLVSCQRCHFRGAAVYEESRRGGLDSEHWTHIGYRLKLSEQQWLKDRLEHCPAPRDSHCDCSTHRLLGNRNEYGRWQLPATVDWSDTFPMRPHR